MKATYKVDDGHHEPQKFTNKKKAFARARELSRFESRSFVAAWDEVGKRWDVIERFQHGHKTLYRW